MRYARFLISLYLVVELFSVFGELKLIVSDIPQFPISADKNFEIIIIPGDENDQKLSESIFDIIVIQIVDSKGINMERSILDYGFKEISDQEFKGDLMRIAMWQKLDNPPKINITIALTRKAIANVLEIYDIPIKYQKDRSLALKNLAKDYRIYDKVIELFVVPKLELSIRTLDGRKGELMLDQPGVATCRSFDGVPSYQPQWTNTNMFKVTKSVFNDISNEKEIELTVSVMDHLKELQCHAGSTYKSVKILVLHHASQITLQPELGSIVENGSHIECIAIDGYPTPIIKWILVKGPNNATQFFNISNDGAKLYLKAETPLLSSWIFNCSATNVLPRSTLMFNRTVEFSVGRQPEGLFGLHLTFQIMVGVAVMGAIIIFCIVIVFIVCMARRSCAGQDTSRNNRRNGVPVKTPAEKKTLEAEQVTLLPPGAPQNHLDSSNTGSGLPPPPPEYQLIIDNEIKPIIPLDQHVNNDAYGELTYAELNTSDLPMKESKILRSNNNDDLVIYSQIIGTMSTPDCVKRGYMDPDNV